MPSACFVFENFRGISVSRGNRRHDNIAPLAILPGRDVSETTSRAGGRRRTRAVRALRQRPAGHHQCVQCIRKSVPRPPVPSEKSTSPFREGLVHYFVVYHVSETNPIIEVFFLVFLVFRSTKFAQLILTVRGKIIIIKAHNQ